MLILDKLAPIWVDLEEGYSLLKDKLKVSNRNDYAKKLCLDAKGNSIIPALRASMQGEIDSYTQEQRNTYSIIVETMNNLEFLVRSTRIEEPIENLNVALYSAFNERDELMRETIISLEELVDSITAKPKVKHYELSTKDMFTLYGEIYPFKKFYRGQMVSVSLKEDFSQDIFNVCGDNLNEAKTAILNSSRLFMKRLSRCIAEVIKLADYNSVVVADKVCLKDGNMLFGRKVKVSKTENGIETASYRGLKIILV